MRKIFVRFVELAFYFHDATSTGLPANATELVSARTAITNNAIISSFFIVFPP